MAHTEQKLINGVLTDVTVFDKSAQEIDDATEKSLWLTNPNLLENWFFSNPVDQKGATLYSGAKYTIDRWKMNSSTGEVAYFPNNKDSGLSVYFGTNFTVFYQPLESWPTGTVTLSALITDVSGDVRLALYVDGALHNFKQTNITATGLVTLTADIPDGASSVWFCVRNGTGQNSVVIKAVKMEIGPVSTLAHQDADGNWVINENPNFGAELLKCQRYYQLFSALDAIPARWSDFRPTMRATPTTGTVEVNGETLYFADANL